MAGRRVRISRGQRLAAWAVVAGFPVVFAALAIGGILPWGSRWSLLVVVVFFIAMSATGLLSGQVPYGSAEAPYSGPPDSSC